MGEEANWYCSHRGDKTGTKTTASKCEGRGVNENVTFNLIMAKWGVRRWLERVGLRMAKMEK